MEWVQYLLVEQPWIKNFEWRRNETWGSSPLFITLTLVSYLTLTYTLNRTRLFSLHPRLLRPLSAAHSLMLFLLSLLMALAATLSSLSQMPDPSWLFCFPNLTTPPKGPLFFWAYVFYLSKFLEFVDTLLILLSGDSNSGRRRRLSFLHVYHHAAVPAMCYAWLSTSQSLFPIGMVTNSLVHTLMYCYYFQSALGRRPSWKKMVTEVQLLQFLFGFAVSFVMLYFHFVRPRGCSGFGSWCLTILFNLSLLLLFRDFHASNYNPPSLKKIA